MNLYLITYKDTFDSIFLDEEEAMHYIYNKMDILKKYYKITEIQKKDVIKILNEVKE